MPAPEKLLQALERRVHAVSVSKATRRHIILLGASNFGFERRITIYRLEPCRSAPVVGTLLFPPSAPEKIV